MKLLKIKSYLIGFIVVTISLFSFNNKASALENTIFYDINTTKDKLLKYQEDYNNGRNIFNDINSIINELNDNRTYDYFITAYYNSNFNVDFYIVILPKDTELNTISSGSYAMKRYFYSLKLDNNPKVKKIFIRYNINKTNNSLDFYNSDFSSFDDLLIYLNTEKNNFSYNDSFYENLINGEYNYNGITDNIMTVNNMLYYSTLDIPFNNLDSSGNVYNLYINDSLLENGANLPNISEYYNRIILTKTYANDLEGNDLYNIRADFKNIYSQSYTYQFKTDNFNDWVDITDKIKTAAQEGYYIYDYSCYYNTNIHFRVLDSNGEVIEENSINVSELNNFEMEISHNPANDLQGRYINAVTVNLHNCWNDNYTYQYSFDNETFYNMEINNKQFVLNHGIQTFLYFRILDENNNIIYTRDYEVIFNGLLKSVNIDEDVRTDENNEKYIRAIITFTEFSEFSDTYNLKYYLNDIELEETDDLYVYEWNKEQYYSFKGVEIVVKIDNFVVYSAFYLPSMGDKTFEDKYDDVVEDNLEEELGDNDYSDVNGMLEAVKSFINAIKNFINAFFSLILVFFNRLNVWLKSMIIGLFIVMVICRIIKAVRK